MLKNHQNRVNEASHKIAEIISCTERISREDFLKIKRDVCAKMRSNMPSNSSIFELIKPEKREKLRNILMTKPVRTASGISVIAVMTKPHPCPPQAHCIYCPGGVRTGSPKSYTGEEPAALRGAQNEFEAYREVEARLKQLTAAGHRTQKTEFIIMGGTFLSFPLDYQETFVNK